MMYLTYFCICFLLDAVFSFKAANVSLRISPNNTIVRRVGDRLQMVCQIVGKDDDDEDDDYLQHYKLDWVVPMKEESAILRLNVTRHYASLMLYINEVRESDSGEYKCNASYPQDGLGLHTLRSSVNVAVLPQKGTCSSDFFLCDNIHCIAPRYVCDGKRDCKDGTDESEAKCGPDPCYGKIRCEDGRCLSKKMCCDPPTDDLCHIVYTNRCCIKYFQDTYGYPPGLMDQQKRYESDMGFLQSTIYTIIGCAVAFIFIVTIMVVAVCRVHMKKAAMSAHPRTLSRSALYWAHRPPPHDLDAYLRGGDHGSGGSSDSTSQRAVPPYPPSTNLLVTYNINNGVQIVGRIVEPPPYSEVVEEPPLDGPPPPYSSQENLGQSTGASSSSRPPCNAPPQSIRRNSSRRSCGRQNSSLLRPNVLVNHMGDND